MDVLEVLSVVSVRDEHNLEKRREIRERGEEDGTETLATEEGRQRTVQTDTTVVTEASSQQP